ncbi:GntR family transcriptional regulator [Microbacterium rhizomatis]|uniref:GntR family transcriptional regulator n=1 Tax=Microbacterium rhizomatis TaxID=1631477 RepID=A0A5J5J7Y0_9MICO|nr:GntR family transcriptional regulator [Microbacterium rhizomatis]KAA9111095.1 GntR family transcriptional regulator [Microbacterium rhizomatis]
MPIPSAVRVQPRELLRDNVYMSLRDAIVDGTLAPGERLRDTEIESWLGVSRTPIREALLRLERAGLVVSRPGRSTTVAPFDAASTVSAQQVAASMHELAARLAVPLLTESELSELEHANSALERALADGDTEAALHEDDRFHEVLVRVGRNTMVAEVLEIATPLLRRVERLRFASFGARDSVAQHAAIIAAARAGDADAAATLSRENWLSLSYVAD